MITRRNVKPCINSSSCSCSNCINCSRQPGEWARTLLSKESDRRPDNCRRAFPFDLWQQTENQNRRQSQTVRESRREGGFRSSAAAVSFWLWFIIYERVGVEVEGAATMLAPSKSRPSHCAGRLSMQVMAAVSVIPSARTAHVFPKLYCL